MWIEIITFSLESEQLYMTLLSHEQHYCSHWVRVLDIKLAGVLQAFPMSYERSDKTAALLEENPRRGPAWYAKHAIRIDTKP